MILCLLGTIGNAAIALTIPQMGHIVDHYSVQTVESTEKDPALANLILKSNAAGKPIALNTTIIEELKSRKTGMAEVATPPFGTDSPVGKLSQENVVKLLDVVEKAQSVGFSMAFRWVSILPTALLLVFGAIWIFDFREGDIRLSSCSAERKKTNSLKGARTDRRTEVGVSALDSPTLLSTMGKVFMEFASITTKNIRGQPSILRSLGRPA